MKKIGLLPRILIAIALGIVIGAYLPEAVVRIFATFNGIFGNFLGFAIPLIIIGFIAPGIGEIGKGAGKLIGITTTVAYLSTFLAGLLAFFAARNLYPLFLETGGAASEMANPEESLLKPFFEVEIPPIMGVMTALVLAFTLGLGMAAMKGKMLKGVMVEFRTIIEKVIRFVIIPLLPLHILGIFANMTSAGQVQTILSVFAKVFVMIILLHLTMLLIQYSLTGAATSRNPLKLLKGMMPAYFTALGTQSSASTIPVTLRQTKKNGVREKIADFSVPLLATIHLSGSTITIVSCAMAVMLLNGQDPTFASIIPFILMLGVTMIAAPGVPGGAVMAAIGLLETMLGFDPTMVSLMIALYLAQDSFGTACNVTGDGALSGLVDRLTREKAPVKSTVKAG
ncbi:cation:dicarboxylase symporter family transporter [Bacillus hwajinpoensis]|uniref:Cation:dicarboxylase symporter family transporter n=1 Tax=Guptibacillus hwajinpoensis TaxID=208199 RepID=A0A845F1J0_9BACL|nr:dicarboxylate/amino acid:cation symporter [Pseudalkalibacillus hwajinpoensis]MYL64567.1 cation:dicarboxylase symporter family transporter [Pseudalkalibacillus hwajinpoensis]